MWCRRTPLVASLTASVPAVLILGTTVSTVFGVRYSNRAGAERIARTRAVNSKNDMRKAREQIEGTFARGLLRPLDAWGDANVVLGELEVENLWRLAEQGSESLGIRFMDEATRGAKTTRQLCARSEPALVAAVGLDQKKRQQAIKLLLKRLAEPELIPGRKAEIA